MSDLEILVSGATMRSAAEVVSRKPYVRNVRLVGRQWVADVPGEGDGLTVGRLPYDLPPEQVPPDQRQHPGLNTGFENYGLTKQGAFYEGLLPGPGLGLFNADWLRRYGPWLLAGLLVALAIGAAAKRR